MRTIGKVKWFDAAKGEGCVLSDGGTQAALERAMLEPFGLDTIDAGVALVYDMKLEGGRLIVGAIHEIAGEGVHRGGVAPKPPAAASAPVRVTGRVHWFDSNKGYGFVVSKDVCGDVLLHRSVLEAIGVDSIREGAVLDFDVIWKRKGPQVRFIHAVLATDVPMAPPPERRDREAFGSSVTLEGTTIDIDIVRKLKALQPRRLRPFGDYPVAWLRPFGGVESGIVVGDEAWKPPLRPAVCKWFSRPKGYGFLALVDGSEDIFVHMDTVRRCGLRELRKDQRVRVRLSETDRGPTATEIELDVDEDDDA
jgi:cold shock protein